MSREANRGVVAPLATILVALLAVTEGYKMLLVFPIGSPSHAILAQGYVRELLKKGHEVTLITPVPKDDPPANLTQIDISFVLKILPPSVMNISNILGGVNEASDFTGWLEIMNAMTHQALVHENIQSLIQDKEQNFDLVIVEVALTELYAGLATIFQCPLVWSCSVDAHSAILRLVDEMPNPSYTEDIMGTHTPPFTFLKRVKMLWIQLKNMYIKDSYQPKSEAIYEKIYGKAAALRGLTLPPYDDLIYNASFVLVNSHPSLGSAPRLPQNVKGIGGYHIEQPTKPLPSNLQKIMDESKHGVIYFSLGSFMKSKNIPHEMKTALLEMFSGLKQTVLWKFEEELPNLPKNVYIQSWMPQPSILAHPNMKIFITHGGLLSTTETVHFGVPIIGIPLFGDQFVNVARAVNKGFAFGVKLTYNLAEDLKSAIEEVLTNPSYTRTVKRVSALYHDRPVRASEELVYWLEYAVRTGGAPHLRSAALLLPWYQRLYLDLLALLTAIIVAIVLLVKYLCAKVCREKQYNLEKKIN